MVSCENCGAENEDEINFCRVCGSRLSNQDDKLSRIVHVVTPVDDSDDETSFEGYKVLQLKKINSISFGKINYFLFVILSLIYAIISVILTQMSSISLPIHTTMENVVISSLITIIVIFLISLIIGVIIFVLSFIFAWIYNKFSSKISGIKFNISKDNKINKIYYSSLTIIIPILLIVLLIMDTLAYLISFNVSSNDFTLFATAFNPTININFMEFIELLIGFDVIFLISSLFFAFLFILLFNLITRICPLKLGLKSNITKNSYSLNKIYLKNFLITIAVPLIICELLVSIVNFTVINVAVIVISLIINVILTSLIYNLLGKKLGGYEINIED